MNHKGNRRVKLTKKIIQESLLEMLQTQTIHEISIRALCERADINRSTFYKYYSSQYELLKELEDDLLEKTNTVLSSDDTAPTYQNKLAELLRFLQENATFCKLLFNSNIDPDFPNRLFSLPSVYVALEDATKGTSKNETLYTQDLYFYGGYQVIKRWLNTENRESPEKMAEFFINLLPDQQSGRH